MEQGVVEAKGAIEKIGLTGSFLQFTSPKGDKVTLEGEILEHKVGIEYILGVLTSEKYGCIKSLAEIDAVGHRVVHGGEKFNKSVLIDQEIISQMEACIELAPLHNPPNLAGIYAIQELIPEVPQVGVFDTAFHQTMEPCAYMYGVPYSLYEKYAIRRYGFHGTSHRYVSARACEILGKPYENQKIITAHIGNGGSLAAIQNGKSVDTSMGMTPVEGLLMGTRSGDVDAGILSFIMEKENIGPKTISTLVNKHSGLLGLSGLSSDMRDIQDGIKNNNPRAKMAFDIFIHRIKKYIGSYLAILNGADILAFTGGIGEYSVITRQMACDNMEFLGIKLDPEKNQSAYGTETIISTPDSKVTVMVVPTDEEFMIASDTQNIVATK